jgi:hypothetical protein
MDTAQAQLGLGSVRTSLLVTATSPGVKLVALKPPANESSLRSPSLGNFFHRTGAQGTRISQMWGSGNGVRERMVRSTTYKNLTWMERNCLR